MPFTKCETCVVKACCREVCDDFKAYAKKKYNVTIGTGVSLKQFSLAFEDIEWETYKDECLYAMGSTDKIKEGV